MEHALVAILCLLNISNSSNLLFQTNRLNQNSAMLQRLQILSFNIRAYQ